MGTENDFQNADLLRNKQYKNASNLETRANLHRRFSTATTDWQPWVFAHLALKPGMRVLECGCGPGWLWRENLAKIPADCQITLTDFSPGMIAEVEAHFATTAHDFRWQTADIAHLPFSDNSFDVVVANHMLYHVPQLAQALAEVRRVLRANGRFLAATNGNNHMKELTTMGRTLFPELVPLIAGSRLQRPEKFELSFRLENGRDLLLTTFSQVTKHLYPDSLKITEVEPLVAYVLSTVNDRERLDEAIIAKVRYHLQEKLEADGFIHITKESGLFIASS